MSIEVVREPIGKIVLNISGTHQNVLVLFHKIKWKSSNFVLKNSGTHQNVLVLFLKLLDSLEKFRFCFKNSKTHQNVLFLFLKFLD